MYIMIHESGDMVLLKELTEDDLRAADDGCVYLLDVSRADEPSRYMSKRWADIDGA